MGRIPCFLPLLGAWVRSLIRKLRSRKLQNEPGPLPLVEENIHDLTLSDRCFFAAQYLWQDCCVNIDVIGRLGRG